MWFKLISREFFCFISEYILRERFPLILLYLNLFPSINTFAQKSEHVTTCVNTLAQKSDHIKNQFLAGYFSNVYLSCEYLMKDDTTRAINIIEKQLQAAKEKDIYFRLDYEYYNYLCTIKNITPKYQMKEMPLDDKVLYQIDSLYQVDQHLRSKRKRYEYNDVLEKNIKMIDVYNFKKLKKIFPNLLPKPYQLPYNGDYNSYATKLLLLLLHMAYVDEIKDEVVNYVI